MLPPKPVEEAVFKEIIINDADPGTRYRLTKRGVQEEVFHRCPLSYPSSTSDSCICICNFICKKKFSLFSPAIVLQTHLYLMQIQHKSGAVITTRYDVTLDSISGDMCQKKVGP